MLQACQQNKCEENAVKILSMKKKIWFRRNAWLSNFRHQYIVMSIRVTDTLCVNLLYVYYVNYLCQWPCELFYHVIISKYYVFPI